MGPVSEFHEFAVRVSYVFLCFRLSFPMKLRSSSHISSCVQFEEYFLLLHSYLHQELIRKMDILRPTNTFFYRVGILIPVLRWPSLVVLVRPLKEPASASLLISETCALSPDDSEQCP